MSAVTPITAERCTCKPYEQSWTRAVPGWCATCGKPFPEKTVPARVVSDAEYEQLELDAS